MKEIANKKTLMAVKQFLGLEEGWNLDELKEEIASETKLLKHKEMGDHTLAMDECGINWGDDEICVLSDFIDAYSNVFIQKLCNVLDSFVDEDISFFTNED